MADSTEPARGADALLRARRTRVVVVGGGVAGLVSALEWAKIGAQVTVLDAAGRLGGSLETALLDGIPVDLVADAFPAQAPALAGVIDELRLRADVLGNGPVLQQATLIGAEILNQQGELGEVTPGAIADLLLVDGNPLADIACLLNQGEKIRAIVKDGTLFKNTL